MRPDHLHFFAVKAVRTVPFDGVSGALALGAADVDADSPVADHELRCPLSERRFTGRGRPPRIR
jgi:hypothetical protein